MCLHVFVRLCLCAEELEDFKRHMEAGELSIFPSAEENEGEAFNGEKQSR